MKKLYPTLLLALAMLLSTTGFAQSTMPKFNLNNLEGEGTLFYQACDDKRCFYPRELEFVVDLAVLR